jgi:hypothetical protein
VIESRGNGGCFEREKAGDLRGDVMVNMEILNSTISSPFLLPSPIQPESWQPLGGRKA